MLNSSNPKFIIRLPKRNEKTATSTTTTSAQSKTRKTVSKEGDGWLTTKPKATKQSKSKTATKKQKVTKKAKAKVGKKVQKKAAGKKVSKSNDAAVISSKAKSKTLPSMIAATKNNVATRDVNNEVIELLSDDDTPDIPLASLKQDYDSDEDETDEDDESDEEFEFES